VSGDMAPLRESGLDRAPGSGDTGRQVRTGQHRAQPSLAKVLATTLHLWTRRRVLRTPDGSRVPPSRLAAVAVAVAIVAAGLTTGLALSHSAGTVTAGRTHPRVTRTVNPAQAATAANEQAAAAWIFAQVSLRTPVACDATTCEYLQTRGMPSTQQVEIGPGDSVPGPATVVVVTPLVRAEMGKALAASAPGILASFGNASEQVVLRVTSVGGAAGYRAAARATVVASARAGRALAAGGRVQASVAAQRQLVSGRVDPRLLSVLGKLAAKQASYLVNFADAARGASWPSLLRSATLGGFAHSSYMVTAFSDLSGLLAPYGGTVAKLHLPGGITELTIEVPAPSPM
jgi:hypothetical protein